jgi:putative membrane protein
MAFLFLQRGTMKNGSAVLHRAFLAIVAIAFVWSFAGCYDRFTWTLEVTPAVIGIGILVATYGRFRFTTLVYTLIALHAIVLMVGGHYTYARVPLFDWLKGPMGWGRNHYDRLGHFMQGFVPALITREILLRTTALKRGKLLSALVLSVCLAISASYELLEFGLAKWTGAAADAFLGTQGDPWDTDWDMLFCLIGAICTLLVASRYHDRQMNRLTAEAVPFTQASSPW